MSYKINYTVTGNFMKVSLTGIGGSKNLKNISADVRELINTHKVNKLLVNGSQTEGKLGIFESIEHIESYPPEMRELQCAIIGKEDDRAQNTFFENAAVNRGFRIYFFYDEHEALKWLNIQEDNVPDVVVEKEY
jgi:hypothetical protein